MPLLFASVLSNYSVFRWRFRRLTIEAILLGWSIIALLFTYSRTGLAVFAGLLIVSLIMGLGWKFQNKKKRWVHWLKLVAQIVFVLILLGVVVFSVAQKNNYFSRLWSYWTDEESDGTYFYYIAFDQRFTYWETAYRIFEDYPAIGVGLGNFTFYFEEYLPDRQYKNPELLMKLVPEKGRNQVVTVKNFFVRLLAETGILGTSAFLAFLAAITGCVIYLMLSRERVGLFWGRAGLLGLISFLPVTLSVDSFALPNMWVVFGLITASAFVLKDGTEEMVNELGQGNKTGE
jgi:O-antigen ligase